MRNPFSRETPPELTEDEKLEQRREQLETLIDYYADAEEAHRVSDTDQERNEVENEDNPFKKLSRKEKFLRAAKRMGVAAGISAVIGTGVVLIAGVPVLAAGAAIGGGFIASQLGRGGAEVARLMSKDSKKEEELRQKLSDAYLERDKRLREFAFRVREARCGNIFDENGIPVAPEVATIELIEYMNEISNPESDVNKNLSESEEKYKKIQRKWKWLKAGVSVASGILAGGSIAEALRGVAIKAAESAGYVMQGQGLIKDTTEAAYGVQEVARSGHSVFAMGDKVVFEYNPGELQGMADVLNAHPSLGPLNEIINQSGQTVGIGQAVAEGGRHFHDAGVELTAAFHQTAAETAGNQVAWLTGGAISAAALSGIAAESVVKNRLDDSIHKENSAQVKGISQDKDALETEQSGSLVARQHAELVHLWRRETPPAYGAVIESIQEIQYPVLGGGEPLVFPAGTRFQYFQGDGGYIIAPVDSDGRIRTDITRLPTMPEEDFQRFFVGEPNVELLGDSDSSSELTSRVERGEKSELKVGQEVEAVFDHAVGGVNKNEIIVKIDGTPYKLATEGGTPANLETGKIYRFEVTSVDRSRNYSFGVKFLGESEVDEAAVEKKDLAKEEASGVIEAALAPGAKWVAEIDEESGEPKSELINVFVPDSKGRGVVDDLDLKENQNVEIAEWDYKDGRVNVRDPRGRIVAFDLQDLVDNFRPSRAEEYGNKSEIKRWVEDRIKQEVDNAQQIKGEPPTGNGQDTLSEKGGAGEGTETEEDEIKEEEIRPKVGEIWIGRRIGDLKEYDGVRIRYVEDMRGREVLHEGQIAFRPKRGKEYVIINVDEGARLVDFRSLDSSLIMRASVLEFTRYLERKSLSEANRTAVPVGKVEVISSAEDLRRKRNRGEVENGNELESETDGRGRNNLLIDPSRGLPAHEPKGEEGTDKADVPERKAKDGATFERRRKVGAETLREGDTLEINPNGVGSYSDSSNHPKPISELAKEQHDYKFVSLEDGIVEVEVDDEKVITMPEAVFNNSFRAAGDVEERIAEDSAREALDRNTVTKDDRKALDDIDQNILESERKKGRRDLAKPGSDSYEGLAYTEDDSFSVEKDGGKMIIEPGQTWMWMRTHDAKGRKVPLFMTIEKINARDEEAAIKFVDHEFVRRPIKDWEGIFEFAKLRE